MLRFALCLAVGMIFSEVGDVVAQTPDQISEAQSLLVRTDRNPGPVDGVWGGRTEAALLDFLQEQGLEFDGTLSENELELLRSARWGERYRQRPYRVNGRIIEHITTPLGLMRFPNWGDGELPMWLDPPPNDMTIGYHFNLWLQQKERWQNYMVMPSEDPRPLVRELRTSSFLEDQMAESSALSYLYYEDGRVVYDAMAPAERFDFFELEAEVRRVSKFSSPLALTSDSLAEFSHSTLTVAWFVSAQVPLVKEYAWAQALLAQFSAVPCNLNAQGSATSSSLFLERFEARTRLICL